MKRIVRSMAATLVTVSMISTTAFADDVDALHRQKDQAQKEVSALQSQLTETISQIMNLEEKLVETGEKIQEAQIDLQSARELEKQQYEDMKLRIKYIYEQGTSSDLEKIFTSKSIAEFLNRSEYVNNVHKYDRKKLQEYIDTKEEIANLKAKLEKEQSELEDSQKEFAEKKQSLEQIVTEKSAEISNLDAQLQEAVRAAAEQAAREEAQRQQAALQQTQNSQSQNTGGQASSGSGNVNNTTDGNGAGNTTGNTTPSAENGNTNNNVQNNSGAATKPDAGNSSSSNTGGDVSAAQAIVNAAYSQLGTPYVWGGTTPNAGLDCSGLTQYCHRVAGISIPRTSGPQGSGGVPVSSPQPGDLVCYAGHVGIYIGGGQMIHAPEPGDVVKVARVYGSPWYRRYW